MLTLIIPTRNHSKYLPTLLNTIFSEKSPVTNLIICNDASTDDTKEVLSSYSSKSILSLENECNIGAINSNLRSLEYLATPYVMFMSSDDIFYPEKLSYLFNMIVKSGANFGFGKYEIEENGYRKKFTHPGWALRKINLELNDFLILLMADLYIFLGATIFKSSEILKLKETKELFNPLLNEKMKDNLGEFRAHDWDLLLNLSSITTRNKIIFLDDEVSVFRKESGQLSDPKSYVMTGRSAYEMAILVEKHFPNLLKQKHHIHFSEIIVKIKSLLLSKHQKISEQYLSKTEYLNLYYPQIQRSFELLNNIQH